MILRDVQRSADVRAELGDRLELKARELQHVPPSSREVSTIARTGVPILPPTCTGTPASRRMCPIRLVVVVFPFEPVIPMVGPCRIRPGQFHFADHGDAAPRASIGQVGRHVGREHDQVAALEDVGDCCAKGN